MKALSIKQPWASLIATPRNDNPKLGIKDIENRTWKTNFRGRIYIHASAKDAGYLSTLLNDEQFTLACEKLPIDIKSNTFYSAIIGEVDIIDCVINHPSIWAEKSEFLGETIEGKMLYDEKPIYNWVLANPVLYDKPILNVKGKLSFWDWKGCEQTCESCENVFDMNDMQRDGADNYFCNECATELFPIMRKEFDEMVGNGEIEPED